MGSEIANSGAVKLATQSLLACIAAVLLAFGALAVPTAAAAQPAETADEEEVYDPLEDMNRFFFKVNDYGDKYVLKPLAQGYDFVTPDFLQEGIGNFLNVTDTPVILANDLLQAEFDRAGVTFLRFLVNTTMGAAGFVDVADRWGLERHSEDFGQTLAVWGVEEGPYLYLPFLGPAPPRDLVGRATDQVFEPFTWMAGSEIRTARFVRTGVSLLDLRARNLGTIDEIERTSIDFYAAVRSLYLQSREGAIRNGEVDLEELPDFSDEFELDDFE